MILGPDDTYQYVNDSFTRLFGYDLTDFRTMGEWLTLAFPDQVKLKECLEFCEAERAKFRPGYTFTRVCPTTCRDSTVRDIIVTAVVLSDMKLCLICEDITEQNKAEQNDRLLASIIQSTADAIIGKDTDGMVISWNRAAESLYGYTAEEMIGQHISRIFPPEQNEELDTILSKVHQGISIGPLETQRVRKDGRVIDVNVTISPITEASGTIIGASTISRDITSVKAEERLRRSEEDCRSLVENISVGMYRSSGDRAGHFIWGNASLIKILGYPSFEQLRNVDITDIFTETDGRIKLLAELKKYGFVKNREISIKRPDGETIQVLVTALARFNSDGGLTCINGIVEDISSQRHAEECVQIVEREMQEILALVPEPILVVADNNTVAGWNAAMESVTGILREQVMGKSDIAHLLPYYLPSRPPLFSLLDAPDEALKKHYPGASRMGTAIVAEVRKNTAQNGLSGTYCIRSAPLFGADGARQGAVEIIRYSPLA